MALSLKFDNGDSASVISCPKFCSACGGIPPYRFSLLNNAGSQGVLTQFSASQARIDIVNPVSGVQPGVTAYGLVAVYNGFGCFAGCACEFYDCDGNIVTPCALGGCSSCLIAVRGLGAHCTDGPLAAFSISSGCNPSCNPTGCIEPNAPCTYGLYHLGRYCDERTPTQKAAGCRPCPIALFGAIITVTDLTGVQVSRTLIP